MKRVESIDIVRGLVMIIMALDHTRDLIHIDSLTRQPTDLATTSSALFLTRWITHLCAPTFIFLSGASAYISFKNKSNITEYQKHLATRGLLLILLDFSIVNFGIWFDLNFEVFIFNVLSAIGFGFLVLAMFAKRSSTVVGLAGMVVMLTYPFISSALPAEPTFLNKVLASMFNPGAFPLINGKLLIVGYPPIPWLAIMFLGYACGVFFYWEDKKRKKVFFYLGITCITLFLIFRSINSYGDPSPWSFQKNSLYTFLSFLNVTKYPPSLDFTLCMLGIMFVLLACVENVKNRFTAVISVYGKVPLLYFLLHWYIIHPILFVILFAQGYGFNDMSFGTNFGRPKGVSGLDLPGVYLIWLCLVLILYPICKWFRKYKTSGRKNKWLSYL